MVIEVLGPHNEAFGCQESALSCSSQADRLPWTQPGPGRRGGNTQGVLGCAPCAGTEVCWSESFLRLVQPLV